MKQVDISQYNLESKPIQNSIPPLEDGSYKGFIEQVEVYREAKPEQFHNNENDVYKSVIKIMTVFPELERVMVDGEQTHRRMVYFATVAFGEQGNLYRDVLSRFVTPVQTLILVDEQGERLPLQASELPDEPLKLGSLVLVSEGTGYELLRCPVSVMTEVATKRNGEPFNKVIHIKWREGEYLGEDVAS